MIATTINRLHQGDIRALGRVISAVESHTPEGYDYLHRLYSKSGKSRIVGITGSPGAGKSTLVSALAEIYVEEGKRVGIVAVDPTSPFTGGALLGDRIRMQDLFTHPNVFIRSMATRGSTGGLSLSTIDVVDVLSAADYDVILVETIGVGQDEVDVVRAVDTVLVVVVPGMGDDIQTLKAGIMEIGDIFVVNKMEREGVHRTILELESMLDLGGERPWTPPICPTSALKNKGIEAVIQAVEEHHSFLTSSEEGEQRRLQQAEYRLEKSLSSTFIERFRKRLEESGTWTKALQSVAKRQEDPYTVVEGLLEGII